MLSQIVVAILVIAVFWAFYKLALPWARGILKKMRTASNVIPISNEQRRWVVIGVCLTKVLTPALRTVLANEMPKWYNDLCQPPDEIDKQVYGRHKIQLNPSTLDLKYKNINNNHVHKSPRLYDYAVKDPLSLARLFVQPFMSKFTGFDQTMDISAVLSVIGEAAPLTGAAVHAKTVRSDIRNEWAHCNFGDWTEAKFKADFQSMEKLIKSVKLPSKDEQKLCDELRFWRIKGLQLCFSRTDDIEMLTLLREQADELCQAVKTWNLGKDEMTTLLTKITEMQSDLKKEIDHLRARLKQCEIQVNKNSEEVKRLDKKVTTELSRLNIKEEEKIPYVFTAPQKNDYFVGRKKEIQELKRILEVEETMNEKKVRVAAVCGMGGVGKTSLVSEYAHQMKDFYQGGVYWFSAEDDTFLDKTVNDVALKLDALLGSFDLTLSNTLKKISKSTDPALFVLDCVDQQQLSSNMMKFLSFPSQENIYGHFVILTRRKPKLLVNEVSVLANKSCLGLECFKSADAKQFLLSRTGVASDEDVERSATSLCEELGRLPLALEQAGAYIQMCGCSLSSYLEQYKAERSRLLRQQKSRPVSPGKQSSERLAVHTTWLVNIKYMTKSPNGQAAVRFMNACSFFNGNEIEEELINVGAPEVEDDEYRSFVASPLGRCQVLKLLTDFSLFTYVQVHSVRTHRLVQELVEESLNPKSKAESFTDAVRMLSYAFSKCPSPSSLVSSNEMNGEEQQMSITDLPSSSSEFYLWSKFCIHGHYLRKEMEGLLVSSDSVRFPETSKILYECAVHLSANHKQEEAKRVLNFAYRMLDWLPSTMYKTVKKIVSNNSLFPLSIPLLKPVQMAIKGCCMAPLSPFASLQSLTGVPDLGSTCPDLKKEIEKLRLNGDNNFQKGLYEEALDAYSSAIKLAEDRNNAISFDPLLLTDRASAYIKLKQYEYALKDANDYIIRHPQGWKGYATKAMALDGLNEKVSAEIAAALAFYHNRAIFSDFPPFKESFVTLQKRIFICDSVDELQRAITSQDVKQGELKILVLGSEEYILNFATVEEPWNNCVLVGTRKDRSVSLKSENGIALLKCMLTNLSFYSNNGCVHGVAGSFVRMLKCNFSSYHFQGGAVQTQGELNVEQCSFKSRNSSGLFCFGTGNAAVVNCSLCNNGGAGLSVGLGATMLVKNSRIYSNGTVGLAIVASKCIAINCVIGHNGSQGISIVHSKDAVFIRNTIFGNDGNGISSINSEVGVRENNVFDNGLWGIWSYNNSRSRSNISLNKIFRNNAGGVHVRYREGWFSSFVIEMNEIYDNTGPGLVESVNEVEGNELFANEDLTKSFTKLKDNEVYNNRENKMTVKLNVSIPYCSNCRKKYRHKTCGKCFAAVYCGDICQKKHLSKHERICKILRRKSSNLITAMETVAYDITKDTDYRKEIGSSPSPGNGKSFIVKVHTVMKFPSLLPPPDLTKCNLILYDRSHQLHKTFYSKFIRELVRSYGVLCAKESRKKKLFFYCMLEDNDQLRLFTNDFPEFQSW